MKKVIRLTESDLEKIVRRIIQEQPAPEKEARKITNGWMVPTVQDN